jgi:hypothetical protein
VEKAPPFRSADGNCARETPRRTCPTEDGTRGRTRLGKLRLFGRPLARSEVEGTRRKVRVSGGDVRGFGGTPRSAGKTPGTTQSRWSSDDDEGVEVAPFGGDREGRTRRELARARGMDGGTDHLDAGKPCRCERRSPPPKEVAAAIARSWSSRTGASRSRGSSDGVAAPLAWPLFERRAGRPCGERGTHRASRVDDTAEALFVTCSRPALKRSGRGEDARDRVAGSSERRRDEEGASDRSEARDHSRGSADSV